MAYIINKTNGSQLVVLEDGTVNTSTSLGLVGRNYTGYGEIQNENFVTLLENSANTNPPARPLPGQTWYNTGNKTLNVYSGDEWAPVGSAILSNLIPEGIEGTLWFKTSTKQLYIYQDGTWNLVGPEGAEGFGITKMRSKQVRDNFGAQKIVLEILVDGVTIGVISNTAFILDDSTPIIGFSSLAAGFTSSSNKKFKGELEGNAFSATRLQAARSINGVAFDGQTDITIKSSTTAKLFKGSYLTGSTFDGSTDVTLAVDASSANVIGKVVVRDSSGSFAAGIITADLIGNVTGDVTSAGTSVFNVIQANEFVGATLTGNATTATRLSTPRTINGIFFDGTENITVTADASTLTGTSLASNVTNLGVLNNLNVAAAGITVDSVFKFYLESGSQPTIQTTSSNKSINLEVYDNTQAGNYTHVSFVPSSTAFTLSGDNNPAFIPESTEVTDLGLSVRKWKTVYATTFNGTATSAQYADLAENYQADADYPPGTVVEFGGKFEVTVAEDETRRIAGVVSTEPAYLMNSKLTGLYVVAVALQGRVPVKVRGKIRKGDMLVSGGGGYARPTTDPKIGTIIGKALQDFEGVEGTIEVVVGRI